METIQKEIVISGLTAGSETLLDVYTLKNKGQITSYIISGFSTTADIQVYLSNVPEKSLNISGLLVPIAIDLQPNQKVQVYVKNNDLTAISGVVMLMIEDYSL